MMLPVVSRFTGEINASGPQESDPVRGRFSQLGKAALWLWWSKIHSPMQ